MATQYFRITAYHPTEVISAIFDSNGMFEKIWQFSSFLISKGFKVIEVSSDKKFIDVNIDKAEINTDKFYLRSYSKGKPENITYEFEGKIYNAIKINEKIYILKDDKTREIRPIK